jgi:hypothetical protein
MLSKEFKQQVRQQIKSASTIQDIQQINKKIIIELLEYKIDYLNKKVNRHDNT